MRSDWSVHADVIADAQPNKGLAPWIAFAVDGPFEFRICDWQRDYSHHATIDAAIAALPAAAEAQALFAIEHAVERHVGALDRCGACGAALLVDVGAGVARCASRCGWTGRVLRRLP